MDKLFYEVFESLPRQGPGDDESTKRAYSKLLGAPEHPNILDIGCGSGKQTMVLASLTDGEITAVDNHPAFLETLRKRYAEGRYKASVSAVEGDMASLTYPDESFDVVWSEGSSFIIGIGNALKTWRRLLKPNGYLALSDLVWFKKDPPKEIKDYFATISPGMMHYKDVYALIESAGYKLIYYFELPTESWWTDFYTQMEKKVKEIREMRKLNKEDEAVLDSLDLEIEMYRKYHEYYGYGFYIMKKE